MMMQYCPNGSLANLLRKRTLIDEHDAKNFLTQIISGLKYLKSKHIIHRDLKLGNIFVDENMPYIQGH